MKAKDSVKNYPSSLRESTNFAVRGIKQVCKQIGPRRPGSEAEFAAQEYMAKELENSCDEIKVEEFPVHPGAFLAWIPVDVVLLISAIILFFFGQSVISLVLTCAALFFIVAEFLLYKQVLDPFFPKKTSHNVIAVRKASGEAKRRIIFSAHADSSNEWRFTYLGGSKLLITVILLSFISIALGLVFNIWAIAAGHAFSVPEGGALNVIRYVFLIWIPILAVASLFENRKLTVKGANDNLSGCFTSMAVVKFMQDNNIRFEDTEVQVLITGSEEVGLRGAKAFCKAHAKELSDMETVFVGLDTMRDLEYLAVYSRDLTGTVKNDAQVCALLKAGAANAGHDLPYKSVYLGASDAAAVTQGGLRATTLAAMDPAPARYYHTRLDDENNLEPGTIEVSLNVALETAFLFDEQGLKTEY